MKHPARFFLTFAILIFLISGLVIANAYFNRPTQVPSQADTAGVVPPASQRTVVPNGAVLLNNGVGLTNGAAMNAGNFQVEAYCPLKHLGNVSQNSTSWFCGNTTLQVANFDEICQLTYNNPNAFVIASGTSATPAFNWRCYAFPGGTVQPPAAGGANNGGGNACGQPCSATLGLCAAGSECRYIGGSTCSTNAQTYCIPLNAPAGWSHPYCVSRDTGNSYELDANGQSPSVAEIQQACAAAIAPPTAPPTVPPTLPPTAPPTAAPTAPIYAISDLNHNGKADVDDYRLFLQDFRLQLSKQ